MTNLESSADKANKKQKKREVKEKKVHFEKNEVTSSTISMMVPMIRGIAKAYEDTSPETRKKISKLADWFEELPDLVADLVKYEKVKTLKPGQPREMEVDSAHAKNLRFGTSPEDPLFVPLFWIRQKGERFVLIGNHRLWKAKNSLKADLVPAIEIPERLCLDLPPGIIASIGRLNNSTHKMKLSSLEEDARSTRELVDIWISKNARFDQLSDSDLGRILSDKKACKAEFPELYSKIEEFASLPRSNSRTKIINQVFKQNSSFRPYIIAKADEVFRYLASAFGYAKKAANVVRLGNEKVEVSLMDGQQQQDQSWLRIMRKRLANPRAKIVGFVAVSGDSKSGIINRRINAFENLLQILAFSGLAEGSRIIRKVYSEGIIVFPNFKEGSGEEGIEFQVGSSKYRVRLSEEFPEQPEGYKLVDIDEVLNVLRAYYLETSGKCTFDKLPAGLANIVFPTLEQLDML